MRIRTTVSELVCCVYDGGERLEDVYWSGNFTDTFRYSVLLPIIIIFISQHSPWEEEVRTGRKL